MTPQPVTQMPLGEAADVIRGVTFRKAEATDFAAPDRTPVLRAGNIGKDLNLDNGLVWVPNHLVSQNQRTRRGDIVMCASSGSSAVVGKSALLRQEWNGTIGAFCVVIRTKTASCDPEFLAFFLRSSGFRQWTKKAPGANIKNIRKSDLEQYCVPLPPLDEQTRTVGILNRAAKIERLRKRAQERLREFRPALFVQMFGDSVENPMGWPMRVLGDLCRMDRNTIKPSDPSASKLRFVGVENVNSGSGTFNFETRSRVGEQKSAAFLFDERHVLYGKLRPYLNKVATPDFDGRCSTELVPLLPRDGVNRDFLAELLRREETVEYVMKSVTGSRMPRTDMKALLAMRIPVPPFDAQRQFAKIVERARTASKLERASSDSTLALNASLTFRLLRVVE